MANVREINDNFCAEKILDDMTKHFQKLIKELGDVREESKHGKPPNLVRMYTLLHQAMMVCNCQFDFCASMMKETQKHEGVFEKLMEEYNNA